MIKRINGIFILVFIIMAIFIVQFTVKGDNNVSNTTSKLSNTGNIKKITLVTVGDIMFHIPQIKSAYNGKKYDFNPVFDEVKSVIRAADISICNFEAVVYPPKRFSGYPKFNVPKETLSSIKYAGFDVISIANNHIMDMGQSGLYSTEKLIKNNNMLTIGAGQKNENKYVIINKNGIQLGILAYTFGTNFKLAQKDTLNYINISKIKKDIEFLRKKSDFIIVYLHSGTEYIRNVEESQKILYKKIADMGADCVLNSHPHVSRKCEIYKTNGRNVFIGYSMGNFLSNQNDKYTDVGLMIKLNIIKEGKITKLDSSQVIPTYRLRYKVKSKTNYRIVLCSNIENYNNKIGINDIAYVKDAYEEFADQDAIPVFNNN